MPTGYTHGIQNGSVTEFSEFAMLCARAFGATIIMRDDPLDKPIPEAFEESSYYAEKIRECQKKLADLAAMTDEDAANRAAEHNRKMQTQRREMVSRRAEQRSRYEAMLAKAEAWVPPTDEHQELKRFMVDQIKQSIDWDCKSEEGAVDLADECYPDGPTDGAEWRKKAIEEAKQSLLRYQQSHSEEVERTKGRNKWIAALRKSLTASSST